MTILQNAIVSRLAGESVITDVCSTRIFYPEHASIGREWLTIDDMKNPNAPGILPAIFIVIPREDPIQDIFSVLGALTMPIMIYFYEDSTGDYSQIRTMRFKAQELLSEWEPSVTDEAGWTYKLVYTGAIRNQTEAQRLHNAKFEVANYTAYLAS